jgi:DNA-binding response OmpR family regulator
MKRHRVLLIEDDQDFLAGIKTTLEFAEIDVVTATGGREGVSLALDASRSLDCIILDIILPEMDGYEVYRELKHYPETADIPVIIMTSLTKLEGVRNAEHLLKQEDIAGWLEKPFKPNLLIEKVRSVIGRR